MFKLNKISNSPDQLNSIEIMIRHQEKTEANLEELIKEFRSFADQTKDNLRNVSGDLKDIQTTKVQLKEVETKFESFVDEYEVLLKRYKKECENQDETILGVKRNVIIMLTMLFLGGAATGLIVDVSARLNQIQLLQQQIAP